MGLFANDLGVDLGTSNVLIYADGKGVVVKEPSVVAVDKNTNVTYPKFELNRLDEFLAFEEQKVYLGAEALRKRNESRGYVDTEKIYKELEIELINTEIF